MDRLAEVLAQLATIADLTDDEVAALRAEVGTLAQEIAAGDVGVEEVAALTQLADGAEALAAEVTRRTTEAAEIASQRDALLERTRLATEAEVPEASDENAEDDADAEEAAAETEAVDEPDTPVVELPAPEAETPEVEEAIAAAAAQPAPTTPRAKPKVPARHRPQPAAARQPSLGIVAAGDIRGRTAGSEFASLEEVGLALIDKAKAVRRGIGGDGEQISVAMRDYSDEFPAERRIDDRMSADAVHDLVMSVIRPARRMDALAAAGGLCAPVDVRYQLITYGSTGRPIRDSLPSFLANRGGVQWNDSPVLSDILVDTAGGAIDTITMSEDAGGATKTVQEITCGTLRSEEVYAITAAIKQGSLADKYNPERLRAVLELVDVAHARHAEKLLFQALIARRTHHFTNAIAEFGAYRDLKRHVLGTVAEIRDQLRDDAIGLRVEMPGYVPTMLVTDLVAQQPGDSAYQISEAEMKADMQSWATGLTFTFTMDSASATGRMLSTPASNARTPGFDADVDWMIFPEGTFVFLDGGSLDLGIIRDSTLVLANRFMSFSESMEGLARFGPLAYHVTSSLCAGGDSQVATDVAACSPQGS